MGQQECYDVLKETPYKGFRVEDIRKILRGKGIIINTQSISRSIRSICKMDCIMKNGGKIYYVERQRDINQILCEASEQQLPKDRGSSGGNKKSKALSRAIRNFHRIFGK